MTTPATHPADRPGEQRDPVRQRRQAFVGSLYDLYYGLTAKNPKRIAESRQALARLRRMFSGSRQQAEAYEYVFPYDPPEVEQDTWLLLAGLFALNPQPRPQHRRTRSLGAAMNRLEAGRGQAATRRFVQLLARDQDALPNHLRQTVRLLATDGIAIDYEQLLDDLVVLLGEPGSDAAHRVRLHWAREFHYQPTTPTAAGAAETSGDRDTPGESL